MILVLSDAICAFEEMASRFEGILYLDKNALRFLPVLIRKNEDHS
jgi:hypothetical protein